GAEIKMEDLVRLYAALANNGELRSLRRKLSDPNSVRGRQVITPEAAFLTLEMLNVPRPEITYADSSNVAPVFWKTGTSHGFHDAWSIGVFHHYVLAVWIGNFDGKPNPTFVGRRGAAPVMFSVSDRLGWVFTILTCLPSGSEISMANRIRLLSDAGPLRRCCFKLSTVYVRAGRSELSRIFRRRAQI